MCKEAERIQELLKDKFDYRTQGYCTQHKRFIREIKDGDQSCPGFAEKKKNSSLNLWGSKEDCYWNKKWIGLPYQDQLQEMVAETSGFDGKRMIGLELCNLWAWYQQNRPGDIGVEMKLWASWEQLWLRFVMKKKYNKLWDDKKEKWIK